VKRELTNVPRLLAGCGVHNAQTRPNAGARLGREQRDELLRKQDDSQQHGAGNQTQGAWNVSIHNFEIRTARARLAPGNGG
jgi:hypothetical protein